MVEGQEGVTWDQWLALALAAETAGLDGVFRSDHYRSIVRGEPAGSLDAWATLAALAARTERIRLGTMVSPVTAFFASTEACRNVTGETILPSRIRSVRAASAASVAHASSEPAGSPRTIER